MKFPVKVVLAAGAVLATTLALTGCATDEAATPAGERGDTLTIATVLEVSSFDPAEAHNAHHRQYYQPEYDSLLRMLPDGSLVPMLATEWEYNEDLTELTLTIRDDVDFTDGSHLDADVVKLNLDRFRNGNGSDAATLSNVSDVTAPDETTVVITLSAPDPALLDNLAIASGFIASAEAIESGTLDTLPVGSGPYEMDVDASVPGSQYTFTRNEDYWDTSIQHYEKIVLQLIPDRTATLNALLADQINAGLLTAKTYQQASDGGLSEHLSEVNFAGIMILDREGTVVPALGDVRVRQAMNYAIDREEILKQVESGLGTITSQIFPEWAPSFNPDYEDYYGYDPEKARDLMKEAGYADGFDLEMPAVLADPAFQAAITQYFGDIGIRVSWNDLPASEGISHLTSGDYVTSVKPNGQQSTWLMANQLFAPNAPYNPYKNTDPRIDAALEAIQYGTPDEVLAAEQELNTVVTEDAWYVPFYRPSQVLFTDAGTTVEPQPGQAVPSIYYYMPVS